MVENSVTALRAEIILDLINYSDIIKSEIDLSAQEKLTNIEKGLFPHDLKEKILITNKSFIDKVEACFNLNCDQIDDYFKSLNEDCAEFNKEIIKAKALSSYCAFINVSNYHGKVIDEYLVGILICTDWYLDVNQIKYIQYYFRPVDKRENIQFECDENVLNLVFAFESINQDILESSQNNFLPNKIELIKEIITHKIKLNKKQKLDLSFEDQGKSHVSKLKQNSFMYFGHLEELTLICDVGLLEENIFSNLKKLTKLSLIGKNMKVIKASLFNGLQNIKILNTPCSIESIEDNSFENLSNLEELNIYTNKINEIKIATFSGLFSLRSLSLPRGQIISIQDESFAHMKKLMNLNLHSNPIKNITNKTFIGLRNLRVLNLWGCQINVVENGSFEDLEKLEELELNWNQIEAIKLRTFRGLDSLKKLNISSCELKSIEEGSFKCLPKLKELLMHSNKLKEIKLNTFYGLESLETLDIYDNKIIKIENHSFVHLSKLTELYLNNNDIEFINEQTFNGLIKLKLLDLSQCNKIKSIENSSFHNLEKISTKIILK